MTMAEQEKNTHQTDGEGGREFKRGKDVPSQDDSITAFILILFIYF